jgi:putative monooxygenase
VHRTLIVARMAPAEADEVARIFADSDATELPYLIGISRRTLFRFHDLYLHLVEADQDITPSLYQARSHSLYADISQQLSRHVRPYNPNWREPKDAMAIPFYVWEAERKASVAEGTHTITKVDAADVAANRRRGGDVRIVLSPKTVGSTSGFMGTLTLRQGEYVAEHYHPYSEEFLFVFRGGLRARVGDDQNIELHAGQGLMIPKNLRHRVWAAGSQETIAVFHLSPLAPQPELGHVDTEPLPGVAEPMPDLEGPR